MRLIPTASTPLPSPHTSGCWSQAIHRFRPRPSKKGTATGHGARGLKILKTLGLYLRENITAGRLIPVDDPRFDPMWDICGNLGIPVAIHISDPIAFFRPIDRFNERYE